MNKSRLFFIGLLLSLPVFAEEPLPLPDAIRIAMQNNPSIQVVRNNAANVKNLARMGNAGLYPNITLSAGATYAEDESQIAPRDAATTVNSQIQATYTLFDGFGNIYRWKALRSESNSSEADAQNQIESIILQVADAYYQTAAAIENMQIADELIRISNERYDRAVNRSEFGRARTIDVLSAQVDLNADSVSWERAILQRDQNMRQLNLLLFKDISTETQVDTTIHVEMRWSLEEIKKMSLNNNAALEAAQERERQARYTYHASLTNHLPKLDLSASYGYQQYNYDWDLAYDDPYRTARVGATLSFNLFNGFRTDIQRQNAKRNLENQALITEQALRALEQDAANLFQSFETSLTVWNLAKRNLTVAQLNFQRTEELYQLGQVTTTQFREAQLNLAQAKSQLSTAKYEAKLNELSILRLAGRLVAKDEMN